MIATPHGTSTLAFVRARFFTLSALREGQPCRLHSGLLAALAAEGNGAIRGVQNPAYSLARHFLHLPGQGTASAVPFAHLIRRL